MNHLMLGGATAAAVAGACGHASAQPPTAGAPVRWSPASEDYRAEYFYDAASVERLGGMIRLRMRSAMRPDRPRAVRSAISQVEINCAEQATSELGFELYGEDGALLESRNRSEIGPNLRRIRSDSPEEVLYRRFCPVSLVRPVPVPPPTPTLVTVVPPRAVLQSPLPPPPPPPAAAPNPSHPAVRVRWMTSLATLINEEDYPAAAVRAEVQGTARVSLRVSRLGRVTACTITESSGSAVLDAATCRLLTARAGFTPARDARGRTVEDTADAAVRWLIPAEPESGPEGATAQPPDEQS